MYQWHDSENDVEIFSMIWDHNAACPKLEIRLQSRLPFPDLKQPATQPL